MSSSSTGTTPSGRTIAANTGRLPGSWTRTAEALPTRGEIAIAGTGRTYRLPMDGAVELPVVLATDLELVSPGPHLIVAGVGALALETPHANALVVP